jgi:hypothetical protein
MEGILHSHIVTEYQWVFSRRRAILGCALASVVGLYRSSNSYISLGK